ncbi:hypothetical protein T459_11543, partial [Capsicum annuum]
MGGVGKTTLSEAAYNDEKDDNNLNRLQVKLKEKLNGKRFLIVLDDVWNDNYKEWNDLRNIFVQGDIGSQKKIAAKCKGLPLALKTLAGLLGSKSEVEGWRRILRSEIWDLSNNDILPALMLSYNELAPHLKPCFSCCVIFPKDYPFRKEQVIHHWTANGLVVPRGDKGNQDLGNQYSNKLRSRSLFERVPESSERDHCGYLI